MADLEKNIAQKRNNTIRISTVISISLVLLMGGLLGIILVQSQNLSNYVKENIVLNIIVNEGTKESAILDLQAKINKEPEVLRTQYISKEQAARNLTKDLGEDFVEFLGYNPLLPSLDVYLKAAFADNESIERLAKKLEKDDLIKEVVYQKSLIDTINQNVKLISVGLLGFGLILLLIAITLINNTIRLAIFSQRFLIKSMQLVGATKAFIRKPFIIYGIVHGLIASILSIFFLLIILYLVKNEIPEIVTLTDWTQFAEVFFGMILSGVIISGLSTWFAVSRFLRLKIYELY
ncbi:MAG: cell division protein FtsX [Sphingobacteriaceae bacterium]